MNMPTAFTAARPTKVSRAVMLCLCLPLFLLSASAARAATVTATWNSNTESNIGGYVLSYGTSSGSYTTTLDVGNVTTRQLTLNPGRYYFVVQAYNTTGQASPRSAEVIADVVNPPTPPSLTSLSPTSGATGTSVTINGTNLGTTQGTSTVRFNGTTATASSWTATRIVASVPSGATTGNVVVTVGGVASNGISFTVSSPPPATPTLTSLSPTSGQVGSLVTITGSNFGASQGTSTVRFNGTTASPSSWSSTSIVAAVPAGATTGGVTVTVAGAASNAISFSVTSVPAGLPAPWLTQDIGSPALPGNATYASGSFAIAAAGVDIWGTSDQFRFVYQPLTGDGEIVARVDAVQNTDPFAKAGVMIRSDLTATAPNAMVRINAAPENMAFQWRLTKSASSASIMGFSGPTPQWVRLVRSGSTITGYYSASGSNWVLMGSNTFSMPATVYVGLAASSHNVAVVGNSAVSNVTVATGATPPAPPPPAGPITLTQHRQTSPGTTLSSPLAFSASNTAGNLLAVVIRSGRTNQALTVTDSRGNTYRQAAKRNGGTDQTLAVYYAENAKAGSNTVTVTQGSSSTLRYAILEYAGVATLNALDVAATAGGTNTSPTAIATTTAGGDLLVGAISSSSGLSFTAGAGYAVADAISAAPGTRMLAAWRLQTTAGSASASATLSASTPWAAAIVAFKPATTSASMMMLTGDTSLAGSTTARLLDSSVTDSATLAADAATPTIVVPLVSDYDGDRKADATTYRPSTNEWRVLTSTSSYTTGLVRRWGTASDVRVPGDYDGDSQTDLAFYRPADGTWSVLMSSSAFASKLETVVGVGKDTPVAADYDGDGLTDIAVFNVERAEWRVLLSGAGSGGELIRNWGASADIPVPADFDGDGKADPAVYVAKSGEWKILQSGTDYAADTSIVLGSGTDVPVPADYDGDGISDVGIYRPSTGEWRFVGSIDRQSVTVKSDASTGTPVALDYDGDGRADLASFQAGVWHIRLSTKDYEAISINSRGANDVPVPSRP